MISEKELQSVSSLGAFDRYRYFIKKIADSQELWALKNGDGDFALAIVEEKFLLPLWSAREYIKSCLDIWENYIPLSLSLDQFDNNLLPIIKEKQYIIDVFPVNGKTGFVVTLNEFIYDLNMELDKY